jgi:hypothetical protein
MGGNRQHSYSSQFAKMRESGKLCKTGFVSYASLMKNDSILFQIDAEIAKLTQVRSLLSSAEKLSAKVTAQLAKKAIKDAKVAKVAKVKKAAKSAKTVKVATVKVAKTTKRRVMSPEARQRIADAQHKRWAAVKSKNKK